MRKDVIKKLKFNQFLTRFLFRLMDDVNLTPFSSNSISYEHLTLKESDPKKSSFTSDHTSRSKNRSKY